MQNDYGFGEKAKSLNELYISRCKEIDDLKKKREDDASMKVLLQHEIEKLKKKRERDAETIRELEDEIDMWKRGIRYRKVDERNPSHVRYMESGVCYSSNF